MTEETNGQPMITHRCHVCGVPTTYWCSRCHNIWYCSVEHMQCNWETHKNYCEPFEMRNAPSIVGPQSRQVPSRTDSYPPTFPSPTSPVDGINARGYPSRSYTVPLPPGSRAAAAPEPTGNASTTTFQAVLFPFNEERPRLVDVACLAQPQSSGPTIWTPMPQDQLGGIQEITSMIITHGVGGAPLRFPLHLFYGTNSFGDGSPVNQVIARMTAGKSTYQWAGNIVALKFSGSRRQGYTDATYNDVAPLIASFLATPGERNS
ncbi:hypothetical protein M407DRAFT_150790 [Tulasnella calospora MUT 4182]|uniref:MYND-type domain-containing protein n=1 Tax=Tulasnella calospora MUT 4182 TaxID=1051891 RepID=A0A0C3QMD6_9AGAM|nr:hypothetical protein M407DRAFT_150790 [Tulasnella calospora MUT 4182]